MKSSSHRRSLSFSLVAVICSFASASLMGCNKDEAPPPLPVAKTAEAPKVETLKIPDAGAEAEEEETKKTGRGRRVGGTLSSCCSALRQNAANAPAQTKGHMLTAAAACDAANKSGAAAAGFLATVGGLLRGAGVPSACR